MSEKTPFVPAELGPLNIRPRKAWAMSANEHWRSNRWYEAPRNDPSLPEVYTDTDAISHDPGDEVLRGGGLGAVRPALRGLGGRGGL